MYKYKIIKNEDVGMTPCQKRATQEHTAGRVESMHNLPQREGVAEMRVSKLIITKWRLSQPETAQEPVDSPSNATNALLDVKNHNN